jgi:transposase
MERTPPLPVELWEQIPLHVQAVLWEVFDRYEARIARLEAEVAELKAQRNQNSQNSSKPPSSDGPHVKRKPPRPASGCNRGGQPGHPAHHRTLVPVAKVNEVIVCTPTHCRRCGQKLYGSDPQPHRHQVVELPPPVPHVTEYQQQRLVCEHCGITTCGALPHGVPTTGYGPRFTSIVALCSGAYRMSKRMIAHVSREVWGIPLSNGEVCALEQLVRRAGQEPVAEVRESVQWSDTNVDETRWWEQHRRVQLWTVVTPQASVYAIRRSRGAKVLYELLGQDYAGTIGSDRAKAYDCYPPRQRQLCWSPLRRDAQAMIDRGGPGQKVGEQLLDHANVLFVWRRWFREGKWRRSTWQQQMRGLRQSFRQELQWGMRVRCKKTAATCRELLTKERALWTFVRLPEIPETNNSAERALRHPVQWRKTSYGTQSECGSRFVESILTVLATCQQHQQNAFAYLTACCRAFFKNAVPPPLIPQPG